MPHLRRFSIVALLLSCVVGCGVLPGKTPPQRVEPPGSQPPDKAIAPILDVQAVRQGNQSPDDVDGTTFVSMEGKAIAQLDDTVYTFADETGQISIEEGSGHLPMNTPIRVTGRVRPTAVDIVSWQHL